MKEISLKVSGTIGANTRRPLLVPSYNGVGGATATQVGFVVTVTFTNPHNLDSSTSGLLNGVGTDVYVPFVTGAIKGDLLGLPTAEVYNNITVTSTTAFTCLSRISVTVSTPQTVTAGASTWKQHYTCGATIPSNTLQVGSSFRITANVFTPSTVSSRNLALTGTTLATATNSAFFWGETFTTTSRTASNYVSVAQIAGVGSDPTTILTDNTTTSIKFAPGANMDIALPITICYTAVFNSVAVNDYALLMPVVVEIIG
jgi:hypothetical protein